MTDIGKLFIFLGLLMLLVGGAILLLARLGFRGLPGDIQYQGQHVRFYFPIVTCIVISLALTAILWLWNWWARK
ncbi:MAG TPA: DUF2905 domain-containing protein [Tepidisphaeraceae bacterium]|jgi:hypothetical protein|nr:DUF2905 domain-containing protein [Tepidisphaeraceae bacterium]